MMGIDEFEGHGDNIRIGSGEWIGEIKLNMPLTEEDWATIADYEFEHSDEITFRTPKGKEVVFTKKKVGKMTDEERTNTICALRSIIATHINDLTDYQIQAIEVSIKVINEQVGEKNAVDR